MSVLFAGASGTGKAMAADVLARELGLDLDTIDLLAVVSKSIGETDKAHDRYANVEVAYLLQKMERHGGMVILASNLSRDIDRFWWTSPPRTMKNS